jgi:hypothetical protein
MPRFVVHMLVSRHARPAFVVFDTALGAPVGESYVGLEGQGLAEHMALWHEAGVHPVQSPVPPPDVVFLDAHDALPSPPGGPDA